MSLARTLIAAALVTTLTGAATAQSAPDFVSDDFKDNAQNNLISVWSAEATGPMSASQVGCLAVTGETSDSDCDRALMAPRKRTEGELALFPALSLGGGAVHSRDELRAYAALAWRAQDNVTLRMRSNLTGFASLQASFTW